MLLYTEKQYNLISSVPPVLGLDDNIQDKEWIPLALSLALEVSPQQLCSLDEREISTTIYAAFDRSVSRFGITDTEGSNQPRT